MKAQHYNVRMDRNTGEFWLVEERRGKPIKRLANITQPVLLSLCADLFAEDNVTAITRDIKFADGDVVRLTVQSLKGETLEEPSALAA